MVHIIPAEHGPHLQEARRLFEEYAASLNFDLCFQNFERELASLPGPYAPPEGALYLANLEELTAGCVGVRNIADDICEMKRLYVRPRFRGRAVGRALAEAAIQAGRRCGYGTMRLDTLSTMTEALTLYRSLGFVTIPAYYANPILGAVYLELLL